MINNYDKEINCINEKLNLIVKQNSKILDCLGKIIMALPITEKTESYSKAVNDFLEDFINNYP